MGNQTKKKNEKKHSNLDIPGPCSFVVGHSNWAEPYSIRIFLRTQLGP